VNEVIQKTISIICDGCGCAIDYFPGFTKAEAIATAKDKKVVFKGKKHFCDKRCEGKYEQALKVGKKESEK